MEKIVRKWAAVGIVITDNGEEVTASQISNESRMPALEQAIAEYLSTKFFS
jgi:hypothetical protein